MKFCTVDKTDFRRGAIIMWWLIRTKNWIRNRSWAVQLTKVCKEASNWISCVSYDVLA